MNRHTDVSRLADELRRVGISEKDQVESITSAVENWDQRRLRASGRSTRQIDAAIQELFERGKVTLVDHAEHINSAVSDMIFEKMLDRLAREHGLWATKNLWRAGTSQLLITGRNTVKFTKDFGYPEERYPDETGRYEFDAREIQ